MLTEQRILGFIGLAYRAGKVVNGYDAVCKSLYKKEVKLLIFSKDISENTLKKILKLGSSGDVNLPDAYSFSTSLCLGNSIGKKPTAVIGITDEGFVKKLSEMLNDYNEEGIS